MINYWLANLLKLQLTKTFAEKKYINKRNLENEVGQDFCTSCGS